MKCSGKFKLQRLRRLSTRRRTPFLQILVMPLLQRIGGNIRLSSRSRTKEDSLNKKAATIDGYQDVAKEESAILCAVARQPVSVGIDGKSLDFQLYAGGIYDGECSSNPDDLSHAVLIVGYDSEGGVDRWIIKNSWGKSWGMEGYAYIKRNTSLPYGVCAINSLASYPTKESFFPLHHPFWFLHRLLQNQMYVKTAYITVKKVKHAAAV